MTETCQHCGLIHDKLCQSIKAIKYHQDGTIKRIEYVTAADFPPKRLSISELLNQSPRPGAYT